MRLLLFLLAMFSASAFAQYGGPAVEACRAYAKREVARDGGSAREIVFLRDSALSLERYTRKVGSQFVSSVLLGNGAVVLEGAPAVELSFICLLANEKQPVFFNWLPRPDAPPLAQCTRDAALRAQPRPCLEILLHAAERDLGQAYAERFQEANQRGAAPLAAYRKANDEWREYRDSECARRRETTPQGVSPDDYQLACVVELTRRRIGDMQ